VVFRTRKMGEMRTMTRMTLDADGGLPPVASLPYAGIFPACSCWHEIAWVKLGEHRPRIVTEMCVGITKP